MKKEEFYKVLEKLKELIEPSIYKGLVYAVGGCVRDNIMGIDIHDIDLCVEMPNGGTCLAEYLYKSGELSGEPVLFPTYGTSSFALKDFPDIRLEAVMTRKEQYKDKTSRNPETCYGTLDEDAFRRDLTINAIYMNISTEKYVDPTGGMHDIGTKELMTTSEPDIIFEDDPLRILRVVRFALRFPEFTIANNIKSGIYKNKHRLSILKQERVTDEITKMLTHPECNLQQFILTMNSFGLFEYTIPNITASMLSTELSGCRYTEINHASLPAKLAVLFAVMFIHRHRMTDCKEYDWYQTRSAIDRTKVRIRIPDEIIDEVTAQLQKMKFSNEVINKVKFYYTMYNSEELDNIDYAYVRNNKNRLQSYLRYYTSVCKDKEEVIELLDVIDFIQMYAMQFISDSGKYIREMITGHVHFIKVLKQTFNDDPYKGYLMKCPVNGNDVIKHLGITGPAIKDVLTDCNKRFMYNPEKYDKKTLIEYLKEWYSSNVSTDQQ